MYYLKKVSRLTSSHMFLMRGKSYCMAGNLLSYMGNMPIITELSHVRAGGLALSVRASALNKDPSTTHSTHIKSQVWLQSPCVGEDPKILVASQSSPQYKPVVQWNTLSVTVQTATEEDTQVSALASTWANGHLPYMLLPIYSCVHHTPK